MNISKQYCPYDRKSGAPRSVIMEYAIRSVHRLGFDGRRIVYQIFLQLLYEVFSNRKIYSIPNMLICVFATVQLRCFNYIIFVNPVKAW
jgi:hypothetical protein